MLALLMCAADCFLLFCIRVRTITCRLGLVLRAQMYVFDLGSGRCLTDDYTPRARTYPVRRSGPHAASDGSSAPYYCLWLGREPRETVDDEDESLVPDLSVGNELQLQLVAKGLRRKFGADSFARG